MTNSVFLPPQVNLTFRLLTQLYAPNVRVDRARGLHPTFNSINQVAKHAPRAPVQRFVRWHSRAITTAGPDTYPRCGRSAEDGSSRVPLPSGRTPRPFAVRVPRGPRSTPPTVCAGPTPTVAGCSREVPER